MSELEVAVALTTVSVFIACSIYSTCRVIHKDFTKYVGVIRFFPAHHPRCKCRHCHA